MKPTVASSNSSTIEGQAAVDARSSGVSGGVGGEGGGGSLPVSALINNTGSSFNDSVSNSLDMSAKFNEDDESLQLYINDFKSKDFTIFPGLYPTIANKLIAIRPIKSKKEV
jgi:hypothetical protein